MSTPFGQPPTYAELVKQVGDLSERMAKPISLADLPLRDLRSKLIDAGEPLDLSVLALTGQVADFGSALPHIRFGTGTLTWPGGSPFSTTLTLPHGMGPTTPTTGFAVATLAGGTFPCLVSIVPPPDATNLQWRGYAADGSSPAAATTKAFYWLAIG